MTADQPDEFVDRVVIVTGAGSGIGRAMAIAFAQAGAHVLGAGRRQDALEETARRHPRIATFSGDLRAVETPEAIVQAAIDRWKTVDVVVLPAYNKRLDPQRLEHLRTSSDSRRGALRRLEERSRAAHPQLRIGARR
jgi:NADP-dependent 3-hydroxy acid dehydrogenase YdfG